MTPWASSVETALNQGWNFGRVGRLEVRQIFPEEKLFNFRQPKIVSINLRFEICDLRLILNKGGDFVDFKLMIA